MKNIYRWDNLTRPEIEKLVQKDAIVIIPTGSTEQHGLHLMVGSDALISTALSERVAEVLDKEYGMPAVVAHAPMATSTRARSRSVRTSRSASSVVTAPSTTATSNSSGMGSLEASCQ